MVRDHNDPDNINVEERVQFVEIMMIIMGPLDMKTMVAMPLKWALMKKLCTRFPSEDTLPSGVYYEF